MLYTYFMIHWYYLPIVTYCHYGPASRSVSTFWYIFTQSYPPVPRDVLLRFWQGVPVTEGSDQSPANWNNVTLRSSGPLHDMATRSKTADWTNSYVLLEIYDDWMWFTCIASKIASIYADTQPILSCKSLARSGWPGPLQTVAVWRTQGLYSLDKIIQHRSCLRCSCSSCRKRCRFHWCGASLSDLRSEALLRCCVPPLREYGSERHRDFPPQSQVTQF